MLRRTLTGAVALVAAALLAHSAGARPAVDSFPVTIHGTNGDVVLKARPTRVVSLSPSATEDLFAVGAGKQVVAVDDQSDYPKQAPKTKLSGYTPNAEAIAAYNPDLVVVSNDGGIVASLQKLGIPVVLEPAPDNVAGAYEEIRQLGKATGHTQQATTVVRTMQKQLTGLIRSVPKAARHLKVYHELDPTYYSATSSTFIGRIYKLFGFSDIADAADTTHSGYPQLSAEYIVSTNPDLVVLADSICCGQSAATVAARPGWGGISAVQHHRVLAIDDSVASRWGPRIVDFARAVAGAARKK
ncbi:MAG: cobalamin transport system substrate-binding protein [Gaiellaceae bacterium]|jgi:iron complex transport system substrate-binding protein|nr:cobalamin transport system substrate-binding protein [Gaiellaceae bacterium]MDX6470430.1 cobalamin transport system substrate-binding protein [Gaiellaceae bacterium]